MSRFGAHFGVLRPDILRLVQLLLFLVFWLAWTAPASDHAPEQFAQRRAALKKELPNSVIVLFGKAEKEVYEVREPFVQESNFYYLTGWTEPGAILLIDPDREVLFLPGRNSDREKWSGVRASAADEGIGKRTGFGIVSPVPTFERELAASLEKMSDVYGLAKTENGQRLSALAPLRDVQDAAPAIAKLRMKKSPEEIEAIQRSTKVSIEGHRAAWKRAAEGVFEYQVAAAATTVFLDSGCARHAYSPIIGSGPNSVVLHYSDINRRMQAGEVVVMDIGAECGNYASDITRTIPLGKKFSARQREIYEIVLGAQKAAIAAVKPGATLGRTTPNSIYKVALDYIDGHGKDREGKSLGRYFTHGIGHHVGLDVHDANDPALPLAEGMVVTVEPGIYIPEENIGIRIEDVVLVTKDGAKVLSSALPKEPDEVERALANRSAGR